MVFFIQIILYSDIYIYIYIYICFGKAASIRKIFITPLTVFSNLFGRKSQKGSDMTRKIDYLMTY